MISEARVRDGRDETVVRKDYFNQILSSFGHFFHEAPVTVETAVTEEAVEVTVNVDLAVSVEVAVTVETRLHRRESEGLVEYRDDFDAASTRCVRALSPSTGTIILVRSMMGSSESNRRLNPSGTVLAYDGKKGRYVPDN